MKFKGQDCADQYLVIPAKLKDVCDEFEKLSVANGIVPVVTRVFDPVCGESGVHLEHRAVDFRDQYFDGKVNRALYSTEVVEEILTTINTLFPRNDGKLCAIHHSFENGPFHFHLQIPALWFTAVDGARVKQYLDNKKTLNTN